MTQDIGPSKIVSDAVKSARRLNHQIVEARRNGEGLPCMLIDMRNSQMALAR